MGTWCVSVHTVLFLFGYLLLQFFSLLLMLSFSAHYVYYLLIWYVFILFALPRKWKHFQETVFLLLFRISHYTLTRYDVCVFSFVRVYCNFDYYYLTISCMCWWVPGIRRRCARMVVYNMLMLLPPFELLLHYYWPTAHTHAHTHYKLVLKCCVALSWAISLADSLGIVRLGSIARDFFLSLSLVYDLWYSSPFPCMCVCFRFLSSCFDSGVCAEV